MRFLAYLGIGILFWPIAIILLALVILFFPLLFAVDHAGDEL